VNTAHPNFSVCALVVVIASATSKWCATTDRVVTKAKISLLENIVFCTRPKVIARLASDTFSTASKGGSLCAVFKVAWNDGTFVSVSAIIVVVAHLLCVQRATATSTRVKGEGGVGCHTLIVDAAVTVPGTKVCPHNLLTPTGTCTPFSICPFALRDYRHRQKENKG
jgi:hypothetical protein